MSPVKLPDNFYDKIKPRLYQRIGKELRLAYRVLDLGCGACELVQYLADNYKQLVTGIDISGESFPSYKNITKKNKNVRCIRKDAAQLTFIRNETIDAAIVFWALHEMEHPQKVLQQACRALRPGGEIVIVEFPRGSLAQKLWNENYYTIKALTGFLRKAGFKDVLAKRIEHKQILWVTGYRGTN
ncbi:MAG: hypothetical protein DRH24_15475 [Deltaproteobacteria bacterium]|nr:MAG: hypothetical protein DRH24_15475 [Deltaproteobacteria bacterium]